MVLNSYSATAKKLTHFLTRHYDNPWPQKRLYCDFKNLVTTFHCERWWAPVQISGTMCYDLISLGTGSAIGCKLLICEFVNNLASSHRKLWRALWGCTKTISLNFEPFQTPPPYLTPFSHFCLNPPPILKCDNNCHNKICIVFS